ncbi:uncharacterized protein TrAtP1_012839 [Trichoderma atroviride]|uniref:Uncharacterized protein n=1 Tax=Hypocrea atroviridis (strain ATCC 20476 / IMI 206040) TaxID=452589 RepID=G9NUQ5_HYPAI|nr:uncharacterized protein TRIATDRAFT_219500 [Trichoderma atroviride IMI 206040]EHK45780.1 hypothetical protein TRIATDRAFT_219500 [Trichoderma atroviride IMI 206040]UKZ71895.1 hypothetical protein TrAtP1_012839 [Trichoderma atroviride]
MAATSNDGFLIPYRVISITDKTHKSSYPAISPSRPALSQAGRTVLVTGGSGGIGYGIALAFATAGADKVIIVGREEAKQKAAAAKLAQEAGPESQTKFEGRAALPNKPESIDSLWDSLEAEGVHVDVLVLNAAVTGSAATSSMWNAGWEAIWEQFIVHVRSLNHYSERFWKQKSDKKIYLVNVATSAIHDWPAGETTKIYGLTKNSGVLLLQQLARDTPVSKMQIVNFHPGAILSPGAKSHGATERSLNWDDISLPSSVAVWAASDEAAFLHGRFIWSAWDVEELQSGQLRERIEKDEQYLRIGVHGV